MTLWSALKKIIAGMKKNSAKALVV